METTSMALARLPPIDTELKITRMQDAPPESNGKQGPFYTLGGSRYALPSPASLKPYQDTKAGVIDTWPAHASSSRGKTSLVLTRNKQLVVVDNEANGMVSNVPKPRFLSQLETFLKKEMEAMGVTTVEPNELRLQAHREAFEYLIDSFKTYKPILSAIKNEYEMMLLHQKDVIRQMEPLKQMLVSVSEECDQKIMSLREEEKQEVADLKYENARLMKEISDLKNDEMLLQDTINEMHKELADSHMQYCNIRDAHRQLIVENNDLRYQQEDILITNQSADNLEEEQDDPVTLRIALKKSREDEAAATRRLLEMEANYSDVIPKRDLEELQKQHNDLMEKFDALLKVKDEYDILLDDNKKLKQYGDEYFNKYKKLEESKQLGPDWSKVADIISGGPTRWQQLSAGKNSDELLAILVAELTGANPDAQAQDYFEGKGMGDDVPKYLQYEGKVKNLRLSKHHCLLLVNEIWKAKIEYDEKETDPKALEEFMSIYLQQKNFPIEQMTTEWAYNITEASKQYSRDSRIGIFYDILTGQTEEAVYHHEKKELDRLKVQLDNINESKALQGEISKEEFKATLQECFPEFGDEGCLALLQAAEDQLNAKDLPAFIYSNLFDQNNGENPGKFTEAFSKQLKNVKMRFLEEIKVHLQDQTDITVDALRGAITQADEEINTTDLNHHVNWVFSTTTDGQASASSLPINQLMIRMENCHMLPTKKAIS